MKLSTAICSIEASTSVEVTWNAYFSPPGPCIFNYFKKRFLRNLSKRPNSILAFVTHVICWSHNSSNWFTSLLPINWFFYFIEAIISPDFLVFFGFFCGFFMFHSSNVIVSLASILCGILTIGDINIYLSTIESWWSRSLKHLSRWILIQ